MIEITKPRSGERTQPRVEAPASAQALEPEVRHTPILSREAATEVETGTFRDFSDCFTLWFVLSEDT